VPDAARTLPQCPAGGCSTPCGEPWSGQPAALRFRCRRRQHMRPGVHCRRRRACMDGRSAASDRPCPRPAQRAGGRARGGSAGQHLAATQTSSGHCLSVRFRGDPWGSGASSAQSADIGGPDVRLRRRLADIRSPRSLGTLGARDYGRICGHCGIGFPAGQLAAEPSTTPPCPAGTGSQWQHPASTATTMVGDRPRPRYAPGRVGSHLASAAQFGLSG
jgi:hypothetical protein